MKRIGGVAIAATVGVTMLTGCAGPNLQSEADELTDSLRNTDQVTSVDLEYTEPITLDSGKLALTVKMNKSATAEHVGQVIETVYDAFSTTHRGEEGDVDVLVGDDKVHVRSFESDPSTQSVVDEAVTVLAVRDRGALVVNIDTQDPKSSSTPGSVNTLTLGAGSTVKSVLAELPELESALGNPPERDWTVAAATGDSIGRGPGLPTAETLALWKQLRVSAAKFGKSSVGLEDIRDAPYRFVEVDAPGIDPQTDSQRLVPLVQEQIGLTRLPGEDGWSYELTSDGLTVTWIDPLICRPDEPSTDQPNPVDDAVRTTENCHPEPQPDAE